MSLASNSHAAQLAYVLIAFAQGCVSTVAVDDLLREGIENPRARTHRYTDEEIEVTGVVVNFEKHNKLLGAKVEGLSMYGGTATVRPDYDQYTYVDLRSESGLPAYVRCIVHGGDLGQLSIGKRETIVGTFRTYRRTDVGLAAELDPCNTN